MAQDARCPDNLRWAQPHVSLAPCGTGMQTPSRAYQQPAMRGQARLPMSACALAQDTCRGHLVRYATTCAIDNGKAKEDLTLFAHPAGPLDLIWKVAGVTHNELRPGRLPLCCHTNRHSILIFDCDIRLGEHVCAPIHCTEPGKRLQAGAPTTRLDSSRLISTRQGGKPEKLPTACKVSWVVSRRRLEPSGAGAVGIGTARESTPARTACALINLGVKQWGSRCSCTPCGGMICA